MSETAFIPFSLPSIGEEEIAGVTGALRSGWLTTGGRTAEFERRFAEYTGCRHALAVNSGTAAMHLALAALGIGPGDEVITTPLTFCATVTVILHAGATPVLADIGADGNIDPASAAARVTPRTRALLPVHLAGAPCDMAALWELAGRHGVSVVEDAAHAAGTWYGNAHVGSQVFPSDAVAYSFYATKNLTTGEGGMVTTNNAALAARMRCLCLHGINHDAWDRYSEKGRWFYQVGEPGFKYNLSDIQSAIGLPQLEKLARFIAARTAYAETYNRLFAGLEEVEPPPPARHGRHAWHLYVLRLNLDRLAIGRDQFIEELRSRGVGASVHFIPIPLHPFFAPWAGRAINRCPRALELYPRLVSLPLYPAMREEQVIRVAEAVRDIAARFRKAKTFAAGAAS